MRIRVRQFGCGRRPRYGRANKTTGRGDANSDSRVVQRDSGRLGRHVDTMRFVGQFTVGYGDYTAERDELFRDMTLDDMIAAIVIGLFQ